MESEALFTESKTVKVITPYRKLRELRGWSLEEAAEIFHLSKKTLINIELGRSDASKQLVRAMDQEYGCKGELIAYWLPKFSFNGQKKKPRNVWQRIGALAKMFFQSTPEKGGTDYC